MEWFEHLFSPQHFNIAQYNKQRNKPFQASKQSKCTKNKSDVIPLVCSPGSEVM